MKIERRSSPPPSRLPPSWRRGPSRERLAQAAAPVPMVLISQSNEAGFPLWLAKKLGYFSEQRHRRDDQVFSQRRRRARLGRGRRLAGRLIGSPPAITGCAKFGLTPVGTMTEGRPQHQAYHDEGRPEAHAGGGAHQQAIGSVPNSTGARCCSPARALPGRPRRR